MHAVKKLVSQNHAESEEDSDEIETTKARLQDSFVNMAGRDRVLSSLFQVTTLLGVGSFGMVMEAVAIRNITVFDLKRAQESKIREEPLLKVPKRKFSSLKNEEVSVIFTQGDLVAIKFEFNIEMRRNKFQLIKEYNVLVELFNYYSTELEGFAQPYLFGCLGSSTFNEAIGPEMHVYHSHHFLVMERLGESIRTYFDKTSTTSIERNFRVDLTFSIAQQLLTRLMYLHSFPVLITHNDLKMDQLMLGYGNKRHILYLVDFGLSLKYKDGSHERWGNRRYAARFRQQGISSPLTDLESAGYVIARFLINDFPWDNFNLSESAKRKKISLTKYMLWSYVERVRKGKCTKDEELPWLAAFFSKRCNLQGNGGKQLLVYFSKLSEYTQINVNMPAESIDYQSLFNCFIAEHEPPLNLGEIEDIAWIPEERKSEAAVNNNDES